MTTNSTNHAAMQYFVSDARRDHESAAKELADRCRRLIDDLTRTIADVEAGNHVNALGVVQSSGANVDRLAAAYEATAAAVTKAEWLAGQMGVNVDF